MNGKKLIGAVIIAILTIWAVEMFRDGNAVPLGILFLLMCWAQWQAYLEHK